MEKAEQGIWPSKAPLGYLNVTAKNGKKITEPDPALTSMVTKLFERYATGHYSLKALNAIYLDKLDGRIDQIFHDRLAKAWKTEQVRLLREIERHGGAEHCYRDDGIKLLELARNARALFAKQDAHEKKRLLNLVLSNSIWRQGDVAATFRQPFDLLVKTNAAITAKKDPGGDLSTGHAVWLGDQDSNLG